MQYVLQFIKDSESTNYCSLIIDRRGGYLTKNKLFKRVFKTFAILGTHILS